MNRCYLIILLFAEGILFSGCGSELSRIPDDSVVLKINANPNLSEEERAYAIRYYKYGIACGSIDAISRRMKERGLKEPYSAYIWDSRREMFDKWGVGDNGLTLNEMTYSENLVGMVQRWEDYQEEYNSIDMDNLTDIQKKYLDSIHSKCGPEPVDYCNCLKKDFPWPIHPFNRKFLKAVEGVYKALTGKDRFTDRELLAFRNVHIM